MTLQQIGTIVGTGPTLAGIVAKGLCTIDDLDRCPQGAVAGYKPQNILRDWISVNPTKWQQIQDEHSYVPEPAAEAGPSPRDFLTTDLPF